MTLLNSLWVEKYRPKTIDNYIFQDPQHRTAIKRMIADKSIPQLIFAGVQGTGKTTIARILIRAMELDMSDVLTINASNERGIDTFREKIQNFALSMAMGPFKIIHLEEADKLTPDTQNALKAFMEEVSDHVRFILTCNHVNKLIPPIRSRCQEFSFKSSDTNDIAEYVVGILAAEKVKFDLDAIDQYIAAGYPDVRKIVNMLQQNTTDGMLQPPPSSEASGDYKFKLLDQISADDWVGARKLVVSTVSADDWENVYRFLYENLHKSPKFKKQDSWDEGIMAVADHLYKHTLVADPEINAAALFIRLGQI